MRIIHLGNTSPCHYKPSQLTDSPELADEQPDFETVTEVAISQDSTLMQALSEVMRIWSIHSRNDSPEWIGRNSEAAVLAALLAEHFGITDIREVSP